MGIVRTGLTKTVGQSNAQVVGGGLRFDSSQSHYLSRTPGGVGNRRTWTWSGWYKRVKLSTTNQALFYSYASADNAGYTGILFSSADELRVVAFTTTYRVSTQVFRDPSAWYHIVVAFDTTQATASNRIKVYANGAEITSFSTVDNPTQNQDLGVNTAASHAIGYNIWSGGQLLDGHLSNVYLIDGQSLDPSYFGFTDPLTNTWRPKKLKSGAATINDGRTWSSNYGNLRTAGTQTNPFDADNTNYAQVSVGGGGYFTFPDGLNGRLEVLASTGQSSDGASTQTVTISNNSGAVASRTTSKGYNTGPEAIDFGVVSGITSVFLTDSGLFWGFKINSITLRDGVTETIGFGTNGFYLPFDTDGAGTIGIGTDMSGRGNHWTTNNFVTTAAGIQTNPNIMPDSPSGVSFSTAPTSGIGTTTGMTKPSNYCTLNPLRKSSGSTEPTISEGNLTITAYAAANNGWCNGGATIDITSGKWYWEVYPRTVGGSGLTIGIASEGYEWNRDTAATGLPWLGSQTGTSWSVYSTGQKYFGASGTNYMNAYTSSDTVGVAFDMDAQTLTYYLNGVSQGVAFSGVNAGGKSIQVGISVHTNGSNKASINFGQRPFKYAPPAGFLPLCTANLPRPTIVRPDQFVGIVTYTGNGSTQSINVGFKPDLVWVKNRNGANNNVLQDSVRGFGSSKNLSSNQTQAEGADTDGVITGVTDTGFNVAINAGNGNGTNRTNYTYVGWAWKAGGNSNTFNINDIGYSTASAAGLTAGTITPSGASVNTKSGFSIITYNSIGTSGTVDQIPHGLGKAPAFYIVKNRDVTDNWFIYHKSLTNPNNYRLYFTTDGESDAGTQIYDSTTTYLGMRQGSIASNTNQKIVIYAWAEIPGFSKFGSYSGNSSSDGPMVITGFKPRWIMIKSSTSTYGWYIYDTVRDTYNISGKELLANEASAEVSDSDIDILSNGFKLRRSSLAFNSSSNTFIYAAFAETPTQNLFGGQSNAR